MCEQRQATRSIFANSTNFQQIRLAATPIHGSLTQLLVGEHGVGVSQHAFLRCQILAQPHAGAARQGVGSRFRVTTVHMEDLCPKTTPAPFRRPPPSAARPLPPPVRSPGLGESGPRGMAGHRATALAAPQRAIGLRSPPGGLHYGARIPYELTVELTPRYCGPSGCHWSYFVATA